VVIEWKKGMEGGGQEGGTGESDKGREIVYGPEESINECKTGEMDRRETVKIGRKKEEGEGGRRTGETGRMT
jgi:hypothetical protein